MVFTLVTTSKFFFPGFATELHDRGLLCKLFIGYPKFKLKSITLPNSKSHQFSVLNFNLFLHLVIILSTINFEHNQEHWHKDNVSIIGNIGMLLLGIIFFLYLGSNVGSK